MTCATCTHNRPRPAPGGYRAYCGQWDKYIEADTPACHKHNPESGDAVVAASVKIARDLASGAEPLPGY